jgi:hypothetical protein
MKTYGGVEVQLHAPATLPPGTKPPSSIGEEAAVYPRAGPNAVSRRETLVVHPLT